jgi:hypothetical protein
LRSDSTEGAIPKDELYGWFPEVLAAFYARKTERLTSALAALRHASPRKWRRHYPEWFDAMRELALEVLAVRKPQPERQLGAVAAISQKMFSRPNNDILYEAWFAELAMAFVPAALQRGWTLPAKAPHPSLRFDLFRLPPLRVTIRPWHELKRLRPPDEIAAEIVSLAHPGNKREPLFL